MDFFLYYNITLEESPQLWFAWLMAFIGLPICSAISVLCFLKMMGVI
jgi:hypothetical protein